MFQSLPNTQRQPDRAFYPLTEVQLFPTFTRDSYRAASGIDPATGDPTKRPKYWFDSSLEGKSLTDIVSYSFVEMGNKPKIVQMSMTVGEAMSINIPGYHSYPPYVVAPTNAYTFGPDGLGNEVRLGGINPEWLSTLEQAQLLAKEWGLDPTNFVTMESYPGPVAVVYPPEEKRRRWLINWKGVPCNVGVFLMERNANGFGTPGKWDLTGGEPNWISSVASLQEFPLAPWPTPVRPLLDNEDLSVSSFLGGMGVVVYRKDRESVYNPTNTMGVAPSGGGLTVGQAADLTRIAKTVAKIAQAAGIEF